jgi:hypothetical protein
MLETSPAWILGLIHIGVGILEDRWTSPRTKLVWAAFPTAERFLQVDSVLWVLIVFIISVSTMVRGSK